MDSISDYIYVTQNQLCCIVHAFGSELVQKHEFLDFFGS